MIRAQWHAKRGSAMAILGIESSAHTFGVGIVNDGAILANALNRYKLSGSGMIPSKVADFHATKVSDTINAALKSAKLGLGDVEAIGYTKGPGLGACLRIGELAAKALALRYSLPIFPVNHAVGHVEIATQLAHFHDPLALYVSGGNSQILAMVGAPYKHYNVYGETLDIGIGNMLDNFARGLKLVPAWGSSVERLAAGGKYLQLPYTVKGMDFAFTGLLTHSMRLAESGVPRRDLAFSLQQTSFAMLCEATERAMMLTGKRQLILCGGVAQNGVLQHALKSLCDSHSAEFFVAQAEYNGDNGAMIALVAEKMLNSSTKHYPIDECGISQRYRIDDVRVTW